MRTHTLKIGTNPTPLPGPADCKKLYLDDVNAGHAGNSPGAIASEIAAQ